MINDLESNGNSFNRPVGIPDDPDDPTLALLLPVLAYAVAGHGF